MPTVTKAERHQAAWLDAIKQAGHRFRLHLKIVEIRSWDEAGKTELTAELDELKGVIDSALADMWGEDDEG